MLYTPKGSEAKLISNYLQNHNFICYLTEDISESLYLQKAVQFFAPDVEVLIMPKWDVIPYDRVSPSPQTSLNRMEALCNIALRNNGTKRLLITTAENLTQKVMPSQTLLSSLINIGLGDTLSREEFLRRLHSLGYVRSEIAGSIGEYAVRGGIIDIISNTDNIYGFRINFFGDSVDSIKLFEIESQLSSKKLDRLTIYPVSEILLTDESILEFQQNYRKLFGIMDEALQESISNKTKYIGMEHWLPLYYQTLNTIFDYLPKDTLILHYDTIEAVINDHYRFIEGAYANRLRISKDTNYRPLKPEMLYINFENINAIFKKFTTNTLTRFKQEGGVDYFLPTKNLYIEAKTHNIPALEVLSLYIKSFQTTPHNKQTKKNRFIISCNTQGSLQRIKKMLIDHHFHMVEINSWQEVAQISGKSIGIAVLPITHGFYFENYVFCSESDIFGEKLTKSAKRKNHQSKFFQEMSSLNENELVVHLEHGIGRFQQIETLSVSGVEHDFIKIIYRDNDRLYVPVENLEIISKYGGDAAIELDKLGGANWHVRKARLKEKLRLAAEELLKIAAHRSLAEGRVLEPIPDVYQQFCDQFPYIETEDQLNAIADIEEDLKKGRPMDRLICGDVGFGKTEVAMRAAFIAVCALQPVQVAVIVPTTLLARQHFQNFTNRFKDLPVRIAQLSRLVTRKDSIQIKQDLGDGKIDIIIGTHSLFAEDVKFKNLGLIIIDEEQHFGVAQKEKLKKLKTTTHILTLSATPIPRTLQMSLTGIKDLSLIATPPIDREPIKTYIMPYDSVTIREVILREKARGGGVFYVSPRISYLDELESKIKEILPEIKIVKAHGKTLASKLDQIMNDFYDGKFDVLLSTTIVESGLDIPSANTIIIDRADMFGLAQLYQIRGRVGRSNTQAYAYLITSKGYHLNSIAKKRLEVIQSLEGLGAGFNIASHDMDIRGQGNLIGEEQSGNMKEIGVELYQDMLKQTIEDLKLSHTPQDSENWSPIINIGVTVKIPESYIEDDSLRITTYRKIAAISDINELESFAAELIDRFGSLPLETEHLFSIIKIKQSAKQLHMERIDLGEKALLISFRNGIPAACADPLRFIERHSQYAKLRPDGKLLIMKEWKTQNDKIKGVENILSKIFSV